jgi:two-component system sensor histidine kinase ChiS
VPKDFLRFLGHDQITEVKLGDASSQRLTIFFTDIRNFTQIAEKLSPEATFQYVNTCLAHVGPAIRNNHGFVDKYIGDAVMALFPRNVDDALRTALSIQREIDNFEHWRQDTLEAVLKLGIGIHFGPTMLGTVGEAERFDVTVISDAVNVASRIEGLTKTLGLRCIISLDAWMVLQSPGDFSFRPIGAIHLAGKTEAIELVEFLDVWPTDQRVLREKSRSHLAEAIEHFRSGRMPEALSIFQKILQQNPTDTLVIYYLTTCQEMIDHGLPHGFDGYLLSSKAA